MPPIGLAWGVGSVARPSYLATRELLYGSQVLFAVCAFTAGRLDSVVLLDEEEVAALVQRINRVLEVREYPALAWRRLWVPRP